jgi:hypothetical protein
MKDVAGTADIPVEAGKEVVVEVDTANPGKPAVVTQDNIKPEVLAAINAAAQELAEVLKDAETNKQMGEAKKEESKQEDKKEESPVLPTETDPNLTPVAGK